LIGLEPVDADKKGIPHPEINVRNSTAKLRWFAWRGRPLT
jgi:hypothetical protein